MPPLVGCDVAHVHDVHVQFMQSCRLTLGQELCNPEKSDTKLFSTSPSKYSLGVSTTSCSQQNLVLAFKDIAPDLLSALVSDTGF